MVGAVLAVNGARGGEPLIRRGVEFAMTLLGQQFVMGETIEAALARSQESGNGLAFSTSTRRSKRSPGKPRR